MPVTSSAVSKTEVGIQSTNPTPLDTQPISTTVLIALGAVAIALIVAAILLLLARKRYEENED
jgi:uncharacterized membrane protein (DUF485 family)